MAGGGGTGNGSRLAAAGRKDEVERGEVPAISQNFSSVPAISQHFSSRQPDIRCSTG